MANDITSWSTTAASNANTDGIIAAEGMNPGSVNDDERQIMASVAAFFKDMACGTASTNSGNSYSLTSNVGFTTLAAYRVVGFTANADNTGAATLNVNLIGAKAIRLPGDIALTGGEIKTGLPYLAIYSTAANGAAGAWILLNGALGAGWTLTSTDAGATVGPTAVLDRNSASPASNDLLGEVIFRGRDGAANATTYARIYSQISDVTDGSEDGFLVIQNIVAGSLRNTITLNAAGVTITGTLTVTG